MRDCSEVGPLSATPEEISIHFESCGARVTYAGHEVTRKRTMLTRPDKRNELDEKDEPVGKRVKTTHAKCNGPRMKSIECAACGASETTEDEQVSRRDAFRAVMCANPINTESHLSYACGWPRPDLLADM